MFPAICAQFSLLDSSEKVARRQVNDLDLVRQIKEPVRNGFTYRRPCDPGRSRAEALDVLHIECRVYIDTSSEQFEDVQISFGISAPGDIAVRQLIDDGQVWLSRQNLFDVHLCDEVPFIFNRLARNDLKIGKQLFRSLPPVGLYEADNNITAFAPALLRLPQHNKCFADARGGAKENL
jgi:hypothetical protein